MPLNAPGVVHVVAFVRKRLLHPYVLIKPVPVLVVTAIHAQRAVVIPSVDQEHSQGFLLALADDIRIGVSAADIRETADVAQYLMEVVRTLPCDSECCDSP